ncbi:MAG: hypothetical protein JSR77_06365 [Planctomycetes bacterium]|nr:hypothetical protein [Planctomycetota bacterium]
MAGHEHTPAIHEHADAWHHHEAIEGTPQHEHAGVADPGLIARWFVGILITVVGLILVISVYFIKYATQLRVERVEQYAYLSKDAKEAKTAAEAKLSVSGMPVTYSWSDPAAGLVQIPIDDAMKKVVEKYGKK